MTPPSSDPSHDLAELIGRALELPTEQRDAFLESECGANAARLAEARSLLRFSTEAGAFIERPALALDAAALLAGLPGALEPGQRLGTCRVDYRIGEGGMGEVWLAEDEALGRKVALKILKGGFPATALRQFLREERIVASLNDPCIARLYGSGVTPEGRPYFVMEYVEGRDLDDYCRSEKPDLRARLQLFRKVCAAVNHAHQHLVIHRDLKPANIRVTAAGEPKLLDFGIARLLDPDANEEREATLTLGPAMTPQYASPEQLSGERVTTASDIYSLGVVLFELLTGSRPRKAPGTRLDEFVRDVLENDPPKPSTVSPTQRRALTGDLDNIVLMAMRREPERRYRSAAELDDDLRRHLEGRPVLARKETRLSLATKFIRRHKLGVAAGVLVLLSLVTGLALAQAQARRAERERLRAERRFSEVRRLSNALIFEIDEAVRDLAGALPARKLIVSRALEYLDSLASEAGKQPELQRELASAYEKIGDIQGNPYNPNLGDTEGALASFRKAEALREGAGAVETFEARFALGLSARSLGDILEVKGDFPQMAKSYRRSVELFDQLAREKPGDDKVLDEQARSHETLGDGLSRLGAAAERLQSYRRALAVREDLLQRFPNRPRMQRAVAMTYLKVGQATMPDAPAALKLLREASERLRALARENPNDNRSQREAAYGLFSLGNALFDAKEYAQALAVRRELLPQRELHAKNDPTNVQAQFDLAATEAGIGEALTMTGQPAEALTWCRRAIEILERLSKADPQNIVFARNLGLALEKIGETYALLGQETSRPVEERIRHYEAGAAALDRHAGIFRWMKERGPLRPSDVGEAERLAKRAAECRQAAAALR